MINLPTNISYNLATVESSSVTVRTNIITDTDYIDIADAEHLSDEEDKVEESVSTKKTRGKDILWQELEVFSNPSQHKSSHFKKEIDCMLRKKTWNTELAGNENFVCKYREKRFQKLPSLIQTVLLVYFYAYCPIFQ